LNSRVNCLLSMTHLLFHKTPNSVSSEPGAAQSPSAGTSTNKATTSKTEGSSIFARSLAFIMAP
jgi:hypothetical protein